LDPLNKAIIAAMYVASLSDGNAVEIVRKKHLVSDDILNARVNELIKDGLVKQDKKSLTELGRTSLKVVLAGGVFDIIHPGHIHTLNSAKALGDILIVVVATDKTAQKMKKRIPLHNQKLRRELVDSLLMVDLCVIGNEEDIFKTVDLVRPEIIALGYDQVHQEKFIIDGCRKLNLDVKVARLQSPIPEFSSSKIEKEYGESIHGI
ncbi:MAG TPA: adenylyltransferase/cytidyltransferase family protein, partial [Nitrosopumilaceae archaeon]|nr:adenylyltransferase/cytidyltransferase family protein [Nitrosopumilaceae archaeon]